MKIVIDVIMLLIIVLCTWNGYKRGLVGGIASILAIIIALFGGSLLSSTYSGEIVSTIDPFVDGYISSSENRDKILEDMGFGDSDLSLNDILSTDPKLRGEYAFRCYRSFGIYDRQAEKMALEAITLDDEDPSIDMTDAVVSVLCSKLTYVAAMVVAFLLILIALTAIANVGNLSFRIPNMELVDEIGGAFMGVLQAGLYCILLSWFLCFMGLIIGKDTIGSTVLCKFFLNFDFITTSLM